MVEQHLSWAFRLPLAYNNHFIHQYSSRHHSVVVLILPVYKITSIGAGSIEFFSSQSLAEKASIESWPQLK